VRLGESEISLDITRAGRNASADVQGDDFAVRFLDGEDEQAHVVVSTWKAGDPLWSGTIDGRSVAVQVRPALNGFDLSHRGVETRAFVYTEREAQAVHLMPAKKVVDSGKALRCPMPGLVVSIAVVEGQEVKAGEALAVVEAMKMENVLRAERDGIVKTVKAKPGDSLAVDQIILEFA
jgi:propionyl-CoA carboxylase alpha subunit